VKRLLLNCDQVFDVLTRGPFPTGEPEDEAVEQHLRACHECRQLAEALRPAVSLLHEAVSADQAVDLPEYQGSLPHAESQRRLSVVRLAAAIRPAHPDRESNRQRVATSRPTAAQSAVRYIAASLLVGFLLVLIYGIAIAPGGGRRIALLPEGFLAPRSAAAELADGAPSEKGLLTLASLKLPAACLPPTHRPISAEHAAEIVAALASGSMESLHCCTECHHAGQAQTASRQPQGAQLAAISQRNCQACHRG
jgi:hypothetical protein